jgi:hypothetical protein
MLQQVKLLSSRRAYEFRPDDLRLSALSIKPMQQQITQLFQFQMAVMGTPMATFGEVPATYPPGFVFDMGMWISQEQQVIPIRFLHFEQRRIVVDVAGPSSAITAIFERLQHFLSQLRASDGSPVVGSPERVLDHTVISAQFPFPLEAMIAPPLRKLFAGVMGTNTDSGEIALLSTFVLQKHPTEQTIAEVASPEESNTITFVPRAGTRPEEHIYLSSAPLDSEAHLSYLNELEASVEAWLLEPK